MNIFMGDDIPPDVRKDILARFGPLSPDDLLAEAEWAKALATFQQANWKLVERLLGKIEPHKGSDRPAREILSELPGGSYLVPRFDHTWFISDVLAQVMSEPVGMFGTLSSVEVIDGRPESEQ